MKLPEDIAKRICLEIETLLEEIARAIMDDPTDVVINTAIVGDALYAQLQAPPGTAGLLIGRGGAVKNAIRTLLNSCARKNGLRHGQLEVSDNGVENEEVSTQDPVQEKAVESAV